MRSATFIAVLWSISSAVYAQELLLMNKGQKTIIIKYRPTSDKSKTMRSQEIPASKDGSVTRVELDGEDPFDVTFDVEQTETTPAFHTKVGRPIALRKLAEQGVFDVNLALASQVQNGKIIIVPMAATLRRGNQFVDVFSGTQKASELAKEILKKQWDTTFEANDGNMYSATVNFEKQTFQTAAFTGRFSDVTVFEDDSGCRLVARWSARDSRGDVYFVIDRERPQVLEGDYTFDGEKKRYSWNSKR